jgi:hypothetical protein
MGVALAIVAPWSVRNVVLYGDPFAAQAMLTVVADLARPKSLTSPYFWTIFPSWLSRSFIGVFGWFNLFLPPWVYVGYWLLGLAGLGGAALVWVRHEVDRRILLVLALAAMLALVVVIQINRLQDQPQGRYLFPGLPALAALIAVGLETLPDLRRRRLATALVIVGGLALANGAILIGHLMPAYYPPVTAGLSTRLVEVTGDQPPLTFAINLPAHDFGFLQFEVSGHAALAIAEGGVYITQKGWGGTERIPFLWRPDGTSQQITIPLLRHRAWHGDIAAIRVDPFDGHLEAPVRLDRVRLRGSLDR